MIISEDWNGVNTGVFGLKNSDWSLWFLEEAWGEAGSEQEHMALHEKSRSGVPYPFEYEQRAVHYLLQTDVWRQRGLPVYKGGRGPLWEHVKLVPQCTLNSYMLYPRLSSIIGQAPMTYVAAQYVPGDFVVHMAGHKDPNKSELFRYCYDMAAKEGEAGKATATGSSRRLRMGSRAEW